MGYKACPICLDETYSQSFRSKIGFLGHRRYLPIHHRWRKSKDFNGKNEEALKPKLMSGSQIFILLQKLDHLQGFKYGNILETRKGKLHRRVWKSLGRISPSKAFCLNYRIGRILNYPIILMSCILKRTFATVY